MGRHKRTPNKAPHAPVAFDDDDHESQEAWKKAMQNKRWIKRRNAQKHKFARKDYAQRYPNDLA